MRSADRDSQDKNLVGSLDQFAKMACSCDLILTHVYPTTRNGCCKERGSIYLKEKEKFFGCQSMRCHGIQQTSHKLRSYYQHQE